MSVRNIIQAAAGSSRDVAWDISFASQEGFSPVRLPSSYENSNIDIQVNPDGTRLFFLGRQRLITYQYDLATPYNPGTRTFYKSKKLASQDATTRTLEFKPDGTKMYVVGEANDKIFEYSLSTAWDVSTASYVRDFSVASQNTVPKCVRFRSDDGTKMYVGTENAFLYQYTLSTGWDISTASYTGVVYNLGGSNRWRDMFWKDDGTKLFRINDGTINEYVLSTAWDLSTVSNPSRSFSPGSIGSGLNTLSFNSAGTRLYVMSTQFQIIGQYNLSTAWDITTASYIAQSPTRYSFWFFNSLTSIYVKPDGTKFFILDTDDVVFEMDMRTADTVSTSAFFTSIAAQETNPHAIAFSDDGTKMYLVGADSDRVWQYSLSTAWDVLSASYANKNFLVSAQETDPRCVRFKTDGTKMYILGTAGDDVNEYALSTAWDVTTASYTRVFSVAAQTGTTPVKLEFKSDGTKMFVLSETNRTIYQYSLSTGWDVSTATYDSVSFSITNLVGPVTNIGGFGMSSDGTKIYFTTTDSQRVWAWQLNTAWDISSVKAPGIRAVWAQEIDLRGVAFKSDGTKFYVVGRNNDTVYQYDMSTPWQIGDATYATSFSIAAQAGAEPKSLFFKDDGTKMYVGSDTNDSIYQYTLSTAWDVSTASYENKSISHASQTASPRAFYIGDSGTKLYVYGDPSDGATYKLYQYTLNTAWDISSASYTTKNINGPGSYASGLFFGNNGEYLYLGGNIGNAILYQYILSTPWDISTATITTKTLPFGPNVTYPNGADISIWFKEDDGLGLFMATQLHAVGGSHVVKYNIK